MFLEGTMDSIIIIIIIIIIIKAKAADRSTPSGPKTCDAKKESCVAPTVCLHSQNLTKLFDGSHPVV